MGMLPNTPSWLQYRPLPLQFGLKQLQNSLVRIQIGPNACNVWKKNRQQATANFWH